MGTGLTHRRHRANSVIMTASHDGKYIRRAMRNHNSGYRFRPGALRSRSSLALLVALAIAPVAAQESAYKAPRTADGKPNLNGIWQVLDTSIDWDIAAHAAQA